MKFIMCILFVPVFLVKYMFAIALSFFLYICLAIAMAFGADGKNTQEFVRDLMKWANDYPPANL